jgi:hypothetical protein
VIASATERSSHARSGPSRRRTAGSSPKGSRGQEPSRDPCPSKAIVPWRLLRRPALGDRELVGKAGCASSLEPESIFGKRSRMSEGLPSGACWPALVRLTPGGVGFSTAAERQSGPRRLAGCLDCSVRTACSRVHVVPAISGASGRVTSVSSGLRAGLQISGRLRRGGGR